MTKYYVLASDTNGKRPDGETIWRHDIAICFDNVSHPVSFSEDVGHGGIGSSFKAIDSLRPEWSEHFVIAKGEWLLPFIKRMASGETIDANEVIDIFRSRHNREPYTYDTKCT